MSIEKKNRYQKVIICPSEPHCLVFVYCGVILALPGRFFGYSGAILERLGNFFSLTTAAQNIRILR